MEMPGRVGNRTHFAEVEKSGADVHKIDSRGVSNVTGADIDPHWAELFRYLIAYKKHYLNDCASAAASAEKKCLDLLLRDAIASQASQFQCGKIPVEQWEQGVLIACWMGIREFVKLLMMLSKERVWETRDLETGYTALHVAVFRNFPKIVKELLPKGLEDVSHEFVFAKTRKNGWTALHLAAAQGGWKQVETLIGACKKAILPDTSWGGSQKVPVFRILYDNFLKTPLHYAVLSFEKDVLPQMSDCTKAKPKINYAKVVEQLLSWKVVDANAVDDFLLTPTHLTCIRGKEDVAKLLTLDFKECTKPGKTYFNPDAAVLFTQDWFSRTPLHWALDGQRVDTLPLVFHPIAMRTSDYADRSPLQIALESADTSCVQFLFGDLDAKTSTQEVENALHRDRQEYVDASNTILVGATLIASVTFGGWLQPPMGWTTGDSTDSFANHAAVDEDTGVYTFGIFNTLAFFFAISSMLVAAGAALPIRDVADIGSAVRRSRRWLIPTWALFITSVVFVLMAFSAAGMAALPPLSEKYSYLFATGLLGLLICLIVAGKMMSNSLHQYAWWVLMQMKFWSIVSYVHGSEKKPKHLQKLHARWARKFVPERQRVIPRTFLLMYILTLFEDTLLTNATLQGISSLHTVFRSYAREIIRKYSETADMEQAGRLGVISRNVFGKSDSQSSDCLNLILTNYMEAKQAMILHSIVDVGAEIMGKKYLRSVWKGAGTVEQAVKKMCDCERDELILDFQGKKRVAYSSGPLNSLLSISDSSLEDMLKADDPVDRLRGILKEKEKESSFKVLDEVDKRLSLSKTMRAR
ncbi:hypothetical protein MPTK1_3g24480 [Marchantia polymorpha subsp. ruderalis]|uniref:AMMECR1 domain-containing protein n=1 Tax=Marchantia polymorpha subsp. ruderalis TaxID=1480154 RepID=A0AAF6B4C9_MARPO|nr:hypothetical protein Mp_3g24480 [Marchantia polymorpha subsp. ruderalis]